MSKCPAYDRSCIKEAAWASKWSHKTNHLRLTRRWRAAQLASIFQASRQSREYVYTIHHRHHLSSPGGADTALSASEDRCWPLRLNQSSQSSSYAGTFKLTAAVEALPDFCQTSR